MTKIAITPNASGSGVFTIAAPNSNDDRTFTLPDATGEVLTDAENNPAKLFRRDNILGTVSQSGGVPTGAIIERGSNANGEFVKYADGTMICFVSLSSATTASGEIDQAYTFPATFAAIPNFQVTIQDNRAGTIGAPNRNIISNSSESFPTTSSGRIRTEANSGSQFVTGGTLNTGVMLFGRWY